MTKPGRPAVASSPYRKRHLSSDARVMKALLKNQPQNADELCKNAMISPRTLYFLKPFLIESEIIKETSRGYALWDYDDREEAVAKAIMKWRRIAYCDPLPAELANETGLPIREAESLARKTKDKTGWMIPNQAVQDGATEKLGEVLGYLARKRDSRLKDFDYKRYPNDPEIVKAAELGLKKHLEMLPNFDEEGNVVSWPPNALKYLRKNYKLKEREQPFVAVIPY